MLKKIRNYTMCFCLLAFISCGASHLKTSMDIGSHNFISAQGGDPMFQLYVPYKGSIYKNVTPTQIPAPTQVQKQTKRDTIKKKVNVDSIMQSLYKLNYDKFFSPQFNKMTNIMDRQAKAITGFSDIITAMRKRAIIHNDSMQARDNKYIKEALQAQRETIQARKEYDGDIKRQTKSNTTLAVICLISVIVLAGLYVSLWFRVNSIAKKIDKLNTIHNV